MTTTDQVLLIVLAGLMIIFFLACTVAVAVVLRLLAGVSRVVAKAEGVVDSVESAADVIKDAEGRMAFFKLMRNIYKLVQRSRK